MDKNILYKFFDNTASKEEKLIVKDWLKETPLHEDELLREREFFDAVILSGQEKKMVPGKTIKQLFNSRRLIFEIMKVAAAVAIVCVIGGYVYNDKINEIRLAMNTVVVPAGQRVNLTLPDGTRVWLNARSEMKYPAFFVGSKREISLDGEAYFEVEHNKDKPFIVHTDKCDIEVLGTKFNVEAYADSEDFSTALMEGSVQITDRNNPGNTMLLKPDYEAHFIDGQLSSNQINSYDLYRWREGLICFRDVDFIQLMRRFEKCYGVRIIIENEKLSERVFSGKFRISDGIDKALRVLQKDAKYKYERSEDDSVIYIK
ncbi:FecR family protein [Parabacteroides segnis]|uniref:FecR family protein n=1 Tax=Parabacteroides segnis TaxID=2763058 RepID=UPI003515E73E